MLEKVQSKLKFLNIDDGCKLLASIVISVLVVVNILYSTFVKHVLVENKAFGKTLADNLESRTTAAGRYEGLMTELIIRSVYIFTGLKLCPMLFNLFNFNSSDKMHQLLLSVICITLVSVGINMVVGFLLNALKQGNAEGDLAKYVPAAYNDPMQYVWDFILSSLVTFVALLLHTNNICNSFEFIYLFFVAIFVGMFFFRA